MADTSQPQTGDVLAHAQTLAAMLDSECEQAFQRGDRSLGFRLGELTSQARGLANEIAVMRRIEVSWEALLMDPTMQFDKRSEVLASIEQYRNAKPATASAPTEEQRP